MGTWSLPLHVPARDSPGVQPVTVGVPIPRGLLTDAEAVCLTDAAGRPQPLQTEPLARWPDGSVRWLLLDFMLGAGQYPLGTWVVQPGAGQGLAAEEVFDPWTVLGVEFLLTDIHNRVYPLSSRRAVFRLKGKVRYRYRIEDRYPGRTGCRYVQRLSSFGDTGLLRIDFTLHNPRSARHKGGLWDLGDPGSVLFRDLSMVLKFEEETDPQVFWKAEVGQPEQRLGKCPLEVYQDSTRGPRAEPVVRMAGEGGTLTVAVPEFWQQFPKALEAEGNEVRIRLFPRQFGDLFELQGGERKTHTIWLHFAPPDTPCEGALDWVYRPVRVQVAPEWYEKAAVLSGLCANRQSCARLDSLLAGALEGEHSFQARREEIDEYDWRNYGEIYADHEAAHYTGPPPVVSHYNNQYDVLLGMLLQYLRTGDVRWFELADPLARHVMDIDIYHTDGDRAAYNGGLFWHTDHYRDAGTATHRAYSRVNQPPDGKPYGGGPSNEHNYTSGLLLYHYLTGNPDAADAVRGLADWVVRMDDGRTTWLGLVDDGPTGFASKTRDFDYHGPGRGAGNSINALLDAWQFDGKAAYLEKAEELIRRCVHPADDVHARDLLNVEERWSYTVFLEVLGKFLHLKAEAGQLDFMFAYARASLLHYAAWMLEHEVPYFDHPEKLEYPTETWAAQDFRKAHVLRLAAIHDDEPRRARLLVRARELADRAWNDLERFPSRTAARPLAIMMTEGLYDAWFRSHELPSAPRPTEAHDFGRPEPFEPQRRRVLQQLRSPRGLCRAGLALLNPLRWRRVLRGPR